MILWVMKYIHYSILLEIVFCDSLPNMILIVCYHFNPWFKKYNETQILPMISRFYLHNESYISVIGKKVMKHTVAYVLLKY